MPAPRRSLADELTAQPVVVTARGRKVLPLTGAPPKPPKDRAGGKMRKGSHHTEEAKAKIGAAKRAWWAARRAP